MHTITTHTQEEFAHKLIELDAFELHLNPGKSLTNGWKMPMFCQTMKIPSDVDVRNLVNRQIIGTIEERCKGVEAIGAVSTAGITYAAIAAYSLRLPTFYVNPKEPEGHHTKIEGFLKPRSKVVVIEDLILTGAHSLKVVEAVRSAGHIVMGVCAVFTYQLQEAEDAFRKAKVPLYTVTNYISLLNAAEKKQRLTAPQRKILDRWKKNPKKWKPAK